MVERKKDKEHGVIYVTYGCDSCKKGQLVYTDNEKDCVGRYKNVCDHCGKTFWKLSGYPYMEVI